VRRAAAGSDTGGVDLGRRRLADRDLQAQRCTEGRALRGRPEPALGLLQDGLPVCDVDLHLLGPAGARAPVLVLSMSSTIRRGTWAKLSQNSSIIAAIIRFSAIGPSAALGAAGRRPS
jgi:hypothetical protein